MTYNSVDDVLRRVQDVVEFLDVELSSVNQKGLFGNSPLTVVAGWGDVEAAQLLVEAGADLNSKDEDGDTPLYRAVSFGHADVVRLLIQNGASVGEKNDDGDSPLDRALRKGDADIIRQIENASR